MNRKFDVV